MKKANNNASDFTEEAPIEETIEPERPPEYEVERMKFLNMVAGFFIDLIIPDYEHEPQ